MNYNSFREFSRSFSFIFFKLQKNHLSIKYNLHSISNQSPVSPESVCQKIIKPIIIESVNLLFNSKFKMYLNDLLLFIDYYNIKYQKTNILAYFKIFKNHIFQA